MTEAERLKMQRDEWKAQAELWKLNAGFLQGRLEDALHRATYYLGQGDGEGAIGGIEADTAAIKAMTDVVKKKSRTERLLRGLEEVIQQLEVVHSRLKDYNSSRADGVHDVEAVIQYARHVLEEK